MPLRWLRLVKPRLSPVIFDVERGARSTLYAVLAPELAGVRGRYVDEHQQPQRALELTYDE